MLGKYAFDVKVWYFSFNVSLKYFSLITYLYKAVIIIGLLYDLPNIFWRTKLAIISKQNKSFDSWTDVCSDTHTHTRRNTHTYTRTNAHTPNTRTHTRKPKHIDACRNISKGSEIEGDADRQLYRQAQTYRQHLFRWLF